MTVSLGIDIGSRSVDAVWLNDEGVILDSLVRDSGFDPYETAASYIQQSNWDVLTVTGYGRHMAAQTWNAQAITEISAYGRGARAVCPSATCVLDIGGQDTKVIILDKSGRVIDFDMNDKCAAGTGKFLEVMAQTLGYELSEFGEAALAANSGVAISSMCAVFAESEVVGLLHKGEERTAVARGIHDSISKRTVSVLTRMRASGQLVFGGGVAQNVCAAELIKERFSGDVFIPEMPQILGALGAAHIGFESA